MLYYRQPFSGDYPITLDFGEVYEPYYTKEKPHKGIDYGCPAETPILAAADGWVLTVGYEPNGYGNYIILLHSDNTGTVYAHLHSIVTYLNAKVQKGDLIAYSGNTGNSTGPHLHFEARAEASKISTVFDPKPRMQSVVDYVQTPVTPTPENPIETAPVMPQQPFMPGYQVPMPFIPRERIKGGLCEVVCDVANLRDSRSFMVRGQLYRGAKVVVSPDILQYNGLPYHKCGDGQMLIAEYDMYGTQIIESIELK